MISAFLRRPQTEFIVIFVLVPVLLYLYQPDKLLMPLLWFFAFLALRMLRLHYQQGLKEEWNLAALTRAELARILLRFLPFAALMTAFTWFMKPDQLFIVPQTNLHLWFAILIFYPLLSVLPQELIYRSYFFRRYMVWPVGSTQRLLLNAFAFGWLHIVLHNWVAVVFSAIGSLIFTQTYLRTRSLAAVWFEHSLYGCYVFTVGLGYYFYHGVAMQL
ncbi:MAG: CPBP family intramembrane glutamic endopeptidase [Alphaproteobacteria bacterium]|nr:CPBP family intramembrane glutamic endopeptidase [Alphaproteobacteria bacterium]